MARVKTKWIWHERCSESARHHHTDSTDVNGEVIPKPSHLVTRPSVTVTHRQSKWGAVPPSRLREMRLLEVRWKQGAGRSMRELACVSASAFGRCSGTWSPESWTGLGGLFGRNQPVNRDRQQRSEDTLHVLGCPLCLSFQIIKLWPITDVRCDRKDNRQLVKRVLLQQK